MATGGPENEHSVAINDLNSIGVNMIYKNSHTQLNNLQKNHTF